MKDLVFLLKTMSQTQLAKSLGMVRSNITIWKSNGRIPELRALQLKEMAKKQRSKKNVQKR
jgi:DNA-binding Xre family transcriptional regulator